jgi:drug/metabolite transporter (DMT)-like permease
VDIVLALVAALFFAFGTVLQQKAGLAEPNTGSSAGLLVQMAKRPVWLLGIGCDVLGFLCQFAALSIGRLAVVQPLLVFSVVFALPLGARLTGQRVRRADIVAAIVVTAGLIAFLAIANPSGGRTDAPFGQWLIAAGAALLVAAPLVLASRRFSAAPKAALLGTATGVLFGLSAALTDVTGHRFDTGILHIFTSWPLYALIVVGYLAMTLSQMSLNSGALAPAVATQMAFDPIASVLLAVFLLHETLHETPLGWVATVIALGAALAGMAVLARTQEGTVAAKPGSGTAVGGGAGAGADGAPARV